MNLQNKDIIETNNKLTTSYLLGSIEVGGSFIIVETIVFDGSDHYVIMDWDGKGDNTYIVETSEVHKNCDVVAHHYGDDMVFEEYTVNRQFYNVLS